MNTKPWASTCGGCSQGVWARPRPAAGQGPWMQTLAVRGSLAWQWGPGEGCSEHPLTPSPLSGSSHVAETGKTASSQGHGPGCGQEGDGAFGDKGPALPTPARHNRAVTLEHRHALLQGNGAPGLWSPSSPGSASSLLPVTAGTLCPHTVPCQTITAHPHESLPCELLHMSISHHIPRSPLASLCIHFQTPMCSPGTALAAPAMSHRDAGSTWTAWKPPVMGNVAAAQPSKPPWHHGGLLLLP